MTPEAEIRIQSPIEVQIDGEQTVVPEGTTVLGALRRAGKEVPTLCYLENLSPANTCRVCVVEVEGSRTLVPSCSRAAEDGMQVTTDTDRVRHSRKMVLEFLASSVDMTLVTEEIRGFMEDYGVDALRYGPAAGPVTDRDQRRPGHHVVPLEPVAETVAQPVKIDDELYIRDYEKCILCYRCVEACGPDAQNTFAIQIAGRGFDARVSTEFDVELTESACVYCGNCIGVCPTGALMFKSEFDMRAAGTWDESRQTITRTVCPYCGVGCNLELHVQANEIVKVTSPLDHSVTSGHLCIKGRFGFQHVQDR